MVVDSSIWIEIFRNGPLSQKCKKALKHQTLQVPSLVIYEVYRKLRQKVSEDLCLEAVSILSDHEVLELGRGVALLGADLGIKHDIAMADSVVLAHALLQNQLLLTLDNDFNGIANVQIIR